MLDNLDPPNQSTKMHKLMLQSVSLTNSSWASIDEKIPIIPVTPYCTTHLDLRSFRYTLFTRAPKPTGAMTPLDVFLDHVYFKLILDLRDPGKQFIPFDVTLIPVNIRRC